MDKKQTKQLLGRLLPLTGGLLIMAFALTLQVQANLGYGSWTVLNHGLTNHLPLSLGTASIVVSAIIIAIDLFAGERIGVGMLANMFIMGYFLDFFRLFIPQMPGMWAPGGGFDLKGCLISLCMYLPSVPIFAVGTTLYMRAGLGAGPRDTLMVVVMRWTNRSLAVCRNSLEIGALTVGYLLGGSVGLGTVLFSLLSGPAVQFTNRLVGFNPKSIRHITIDMIPGIVTGKTQLDATTADPSA
jgi:uncharacterized membrane protein YczE